MVAQLVQTNLRPQRPTQPGDDPPRLVLTREEPAVNTVLEPRAERPEQRRYDQHGDDDGDLDGCHVIGESQGDNRGADGVDGHQADGKSAVDEHAIDERRAVVGAHLQHGEPDRHGHQRHDEKHRRARGRRQKRPGSERRCEQERRDDQREEPNAQGGAQGAPAGRQAHACLGEMMVARVDLRGDPDDDE